jgi:hypothetical protein
VNNPFVFLATETAAFLLFYAMNVPRKEPEYVLLQLKDLKKQLF